jgi:hypothetical protein
VRVSKTDVIAGLPAELARAIVRKFRGRQMVAEIAEDLLAGTGFELDAVFCRPGIRRVPGEDPDRPPR